MYVIAILTLLGLAYLAPILVAMQRGHPYTPAIAGLILLGGWTIVGWVVALAWAIGPWPRRIPALG